MSQMLFRRHIHGAAQDGINGSEAIGRVKGKVFRNSEIGQIAIVIGIKENVIRFDIAVNPIIGMHKGKSSANFGNPLA